MACVIPEIRGGLSRGEEGALWQQVCLDGSARTTPRIRAELEASQETTHVLTFITAYNFARHLKALRWRTPFQAICDAWTKDRAPFRINPHHLIPGPHT